jgi:hypothetical protein
MKAIHLANTRITDAVLTSVAGMVGIDELSLGGTQITDPGMRELQVALPELSSEH